MKQALRASDDSQRLISTPLAIQTSYLFSPDLVILSKPQGAPAEAIRVLRTYLMTHHVHEGRRALAVCAASAGVGCTFTAANLAVSLSQVGVKTLLIDGNMRDPGVDRMIRPSSPREGLRHCLASDDLYFHDAIEADVMPSLSVMYSGGVAPEGQELLAGSRFKDLMEFCLRDYEATIMDTPPANTSSNVRRISTVVGYSLLVARANHSLVGDVKILAEQLRGDHAQVIGTVLNEA
jgi:capsular exopolysaccharide synthesis family protein